MALPATPAGALDGLAIRSSTTFRVLPEAEAILVEAQYSVTNVTPDRTRGRQVTQYYYNGLSVPVPIDAVDVKAIRSDGRNLKIVLDEPEGAVPSVFAEVNFGRNVYYRKTTTFTVSYSLPSAAVRDDYSGVRVNPAYAVFGAYGIGDPNAVSVRVEVPLEFDVEIEGSSFTSTEEENIRVYEATDIEDPEGFYLFVVARNDAALESRLVDLPDGKQVNVQHWPGDDEWADFVEEELLTSFVGMQDLIGLPFEDEELAIVESVDPSLQGYAGWYIPDEELIEVSEDLDDQLILHELSHAWFNGDMFRGRWITEGLAEEFSARAIEAEGDTLPRPTRPSKLDRSALALNNWFVQYNNDLDAQLVDQYGYNTAWHVMRQLTEEIGIEGLAQIVQDADANLIAYRGEVEPEVVDTEIDDWRRFLDLAQESAGSEEVEDLFRNWVLPSSATTILDSRADAREMYFLLAETGDDWAMPLALRRQMGSWRFVDIDEMFDATEAVLLERKELNHAAAFASLEVPLTAEEMFESAETIDQLAEAEAVVATFIASAKLINAAKSEVDSDRGLVEKVGLIGADHVAPYEQARSLFASGSLAESDEKAQLALTGFADAQVQGQNRLAIVAAVLVGLFIVFVLLVRRRRSRRPSVQDLEPTDMPASFETELTSA